MAVEAIGGVTGSASATAINRAEEPSGARRPGDATAKDSTAKDSTIVISKVTRTKDDGSTVTTTTYADGHTKIETTPPKFSPEESKTGPSEGRSAPSAEGQAEGRITAVDLLA